MVWSISNNDVPNIWPLSRCCLVSNTERQIEGDFISQSWREFHRLCERNHFTRNHCWVLQKYPPYPDYRVSSVSEKPIERSLSASSGGSAEVTQLKEAVISEETFSCFLFLSVSARLRDGTQVVFQFVPAVVSAETQDQLRPSSTDSLVEGSFFLDTSSAVDIVKGRERERNPGSLDFNL